MSVAHERGASVGTAPLAYRIGNDAPEDMLAPFNSPLRKYAVLITDSMGAVESMAVTANEPEGLLYAPGNWEREQLTAIGHAVVKAAGAVRALLSPPHIDETSAAILH